MDVLSFGRIVTPVVFRPVRTHAFLLGAFP
jgi:hypothetical protein